MKMKLEIISLRTKVALRTFGLFFLCAMITIAAMAIPSFYKVTDELDKQGRSRLHQESKTVGQAILERRGFLEADLKLIRLDSRSGSAIIPQMASEVSRKDFTRRFKGLLLVTNAGGQQLLYGRVLDPPEFTPLEEQSLRSGDSLVISRVQLHGPARLFMSRMLDPQTPIRGILVAEINPSYLWVAGDKSTLPLRTELCLVDQSNNLLFCSIDVPPSFSDELARSMAAEQGLRNKTGSALRVFEWRQGGKEYLAGYWPMFLESKFFTPNWIVVLSQSKADVYAPIVDFNRNLLGVSVLVLGVVTWMSLRQIHKRFVPVEKLQDGTRRIAAREFDTRVTVTSGDEFEELAASFNTMAAQLGRQFHTLTTMAEIDRAVLSALDTRAIVNAVLTRMRHVFPCDGVGVTLCDPKAQESVRTYVANGQPAGVPVAEAIVLTPDEVGRLRDNPESLLLVDQDIPPYLAPLAARGHNAFLLLPLFIQGRLSGIITLGYNSSPVYSEDDLVRARQVADQVAVALSNARLLEELDQMNWGTLTALARAIDAKSPWTRGHSERVTDLALKIGRVLGFSQKELEVMHRGGLLHDIGKIGTPPAVLDKAGRLTEEETRLMREHVRMGARILEPIPAYEEVMPIVLQHHERYDGTGYPQGLAGGEISLAARTFAVADCFDALISDRPYRKGLAREQVIEFIKQGAGRQFDPKVVDAFLEVMGQEEAKSSRQPTPVPSVLAS